MSTKLGIYFKINKWLPKNDSQPMQLLPRTPLSNIGAIQVLMRYKLKADHRADECDDKEDAPKAHRIFKDQHAENCCSKRTDSGPDRIGSSYRKCLYDFHE